MTHRTEKPSPTESSTDTLISALDVIAKQLEESDYGASLALQEAAQRLDKLEKELERHKERLGAIKKHMFQSQWNGVIDSGNKTTWRVTGDYRHFVQRMEGIDFSNAVDLAIERSKQ